MKTTTEMKKLETSVINWQSGYRAAGAALARLKTLHKGPWRVYVLARFDLTAAKCHRLIKAAEVCDQLERLGFKTMPTNEGQANALVSLGDVEISTIWQAVGDKPTMAKIEAAKKENGGEVTVMPSGRKTLAQVKQASTLLSKIMSELPKLSQDDAASVREALDGLRGLLTGQTVWKVSEAA